MPVKYCPFCGQEVGGHTFKFCPHCGLALPTSATEAAPAVEVVSPAPPAKGTGTTPRVQDHPSGNGEKIDEPEAESGALPHTPRPRVNTAGRAVCNLVFLGIAIACGYMIGLSSAAGRMVTAMWSSVHAGARTVLSRIPLASAMADNWSRQIADWVAQNSYGITPTQLSQGTGLLYVLVAALFVASLAANLARWPGEK